MPRVTIPPPHLIARRNLHTSFTSRAAFPFASGPAPPRLPEKEQKEFEELQRSSTGAFSTPRSALAVDESPELSSPISLSRPRPQINQSPQSSAVKQNIDARVKATGDGEELHPDIRRGAKPEFEGDRNPKTGEIGGPKNEPLRWGGEVDWSYNGRVTDF